MRGGEAEAEEEEEEIAWKRHGSVGGEEIQGRANVQDVSYKTRMALRIG